RRGDAEETGQLAKLRLVQIADRIDRRGHVAEDRSVPQEQLGLVARAERYRAEDLRAVVQDGHALARHLVPGAHAIDLFDAALGGEVGVDLWREVVLLRANAEAADDLARVGQGFRVAGAIRQQEGRDVLRAIGLGREVGDRRRIDAAGDVDDRFAETGFGGFVAEE